MKFYLSHPIRGKAGPNASHDVQAKNCAEAIRVADILRGLFTKLELYVPAEHETFIQIAYDAGHLNEGQILNIDCRIIEMCFLNGQIRSADWIIKTFNLPPDHVSDCAILAILTLPTLDSRIVTIDGSRVTPSVFSPDRGKMDSLSGVDIDCTTGNYRPLLDLIVDTYGITANDIRDHIANDLTPKISKPTSQQAKRG